MATARTGGWGSQASAFVRGGESRYARVLIDGVPVNQPGGLYDFGSALPLELERVEVVRGAASSLYGTDALAGVVQLVTRRAEPGAAPGVDAEADGGELRLEARRRPGPRGGPGAFDWNLGLLRLETDNEVPNSAFDETAAAASSGRARLGDASSLRLVLAVRGQHRGHARADRLRPARSGRVASSATTSWSPRRSATSRTSA